MANQYATLADWARRRDPNGRIGAIAELLSQCNDIFDDMLWREGNLETGHKATVRTGLPTNTWRMINQGVAFSKDTTAQLTFGCGELVAYSRVDRTLAELEANLNEFRLSQSKSQLESMSQTLATTIFYGNASITPQSFTGFSSYYSTVNTTTAQSAKNVIDMGGTASANASLWLLGWGEMASYGIYPKGSKAGLLHEDKGTVRPGIDANGFEYEAYTDFFRWQAGLAVEDWRYNVRMANIDTTSAGLAGVNPPDLFASMSQAVVKMPKMSKRISGIVKTDAPDGDAQGVNAAWYCNRTVRYHLDIQAIRNKNVLLTPREYAGEAVTDFRGAPIRVVDALLNSEARVV